MFKTISSKQLYSLIFISSKRDSTLPKTATHQQFRISDSTKTSWLRNKKPSLMRSLLLGIQKMLPKSSKKSAISRHQFTPNLSLKNILHKVKASPNRFTFQPPILFPIQGEDRDPFTPSYLIREFEQDYLEIIEENQQITCLANLRLPLQGILKRSKKGLYYLDISDRFIETLFPLLSEPKMENAMSYFDQTIGAHIPVMLESESKKQGLGAIPELGSKYSFTVTGCFSTKPQLSSEFKKIWFLTISSKSLEHLREKYHLPSKMRGYDFTIVIGIQKKPFAGLKLSSSPTVFYRINTAELPA